MIKMLVSGKVQENLQLQSELHHRRLIKVHNPSCIMVPTCLSNFKCLQQCCILMLHQLKVEFDLLHQRS